jgi:hypothetical protein
MARPELLDRRGGWGGVLRVQPLSSQEAALLIDARIDHHELDDDVRQRILAAAGGNPLFVQEMAAMVQSGDGDGDVEVPATLQALLAARLDQLDAPERSVLERGAVEGEVFHHAVVQALMPDAAGLAPQLTALVRKELIRPDRPLFAGEDAFRFRHLLMRDAAYDAMPKAERADLHERFADWLEAHGQDLVELDELAGYHLEQAYRYRLDLGHEDDALAARARRRLAEAGSRAIARSDFRAALNLLERASALVSRERPDVRLEFDLAWARFHVGMGHEAVRSLAAAAERATAAGDHRGALALEIEQATYDTVLNPPVAGSGERLRLQVEQALAVFEEAGDEWGLTVAGASLIIAGELEGRSWAELAAQAEFLLEHARRAGSRLYEDWAEEELVLANYFGETPVEVALSWLDDHPHIERGGATPQREIYLAMLGRFEEARALLAQAEERAEQLSANRVEIGLANRRFRIAMLEGDPAVAEAAARHACEAAETIEYFGNYMAYCCNLAEALLELRRDEEAEQWLLRGREKAASEEPAPRIQWTHLYGRVLARRGELEEGERLAREAVALAEGTDMPNFQAAARADLAEVLALAGKDSRQELERALALYEQKGNLVMAERTREKLAELG